MTKKVYLSPRYKDWYIANVCPIPEAFFFKLTRPVNVLSVSEHTDYGQVAHVEQDSVVCYHVPVKFLIPILDWREIF